MWTIGYISKIINNTIYLTYTHVGCNIYYPYGDLPDSSYAYENDESNY